MKLTENQKQIISSLKEEFAKINKESVISSPSIIDHLFQQANKYTTERDNFYNEIKLNNLQVEHKREELLKGFYNKLNELFKNYSDITVYRNKNSIYVGYNVSVGSEKHSFKRGYFYLSGNVTICHKQFDKNNSNVNEYLEAVVGIDSKYLSLEDFETTEIFKSKVIEMFKRK